MAQQQTIRTTFEKLSLVSHFPVEFSIENKRSIKFTYPTIEELFTELDLQLFITLISLNKEKIKQFQLPINFQSETKGEIVSGLMAFTEYKTILSKYFLKYIYKSQEKDGALYVEDEKINTKELDYIIKITLISSGLEPLDEEELKKAPSQKVNPEIEAILAKQKEAEEKLKKIKQKKAEKSGLSIEQIMLAINYEFGISLKELIKLNYYSLFWYFGFVGKVDSHKLNQLIISSGFSKKKDYSYWLNK
jgi:hypothetical protein